MPLNKLVIGLLQTDTNLPLFPDEKLVQQGVEVRAVEIEGVDYDSSDDAEVRMVIVQQPRRRPYSNAALQILRRRFPLALFVCINGRWIEGAQRSGRPYAGFIHVRACEAVHRIQRLIGGFQYKPQVMGEYRPLFSARESLNWWLNVGLAQVAKEDARDVYVYGHRDATGGISRAFINAGWNVEQRSFRTLTALQTQNGDAFHEGGATLGVVRGRVQVRQLVQSNLLQQFDLLIADNITRHEQRKFEELYHCQVLAKPFQNDDLIEALGSLRQGVMNEAA